MAPNIESKKKSRTVLRSNFTRTANELEARLCEVCPDDNVIRISRDMLQAKFETLSVVEGEFFELLLEEADESELEAEVQGRDEYLRKFTALKVKVNDFLENISQSSNPTAITGQLSNVSKRRFELPRIEFKHYDGSIRDWLAFWGQFSKIHDDPSIDNSDKIEYLFQATLPGSRARQLVESYPAMGDNYYKIIDSMKNRFGREDLHIEVYKGYKGNVKADSVQHIFTR